jgi:hypothetical protein
VIAAIEPARLAGLAGSPSAKGNIMSKFGSLVPSDKPHRVYIKFNGKQIVANNGERMFIDVYFEDSVVGRRFDKQQRDQALSNARDGTEPPSQLEINIAKCAALTAGGYLVNLDTLEPIPGPFMVEDARELYSLEGAGWLWFQVWAAANNHANFIKHSAGNSSLSQSGNSAIAAE